MNGSDGRDELPVGGGRSADLYLIVGLGNPGDEYAHTRHNAGFDAVDAIAEEIGVRY